MLRPCRQSDQIELAHVPHSYVRCFLWVIENTTPFLIELVSLFRLSNILAFLNITSVILCKPVCRYLLLDEKLNGLQLVGASVTLLSIYLVNRKVQPDSEKTD